MTFHIASLLPVNRLLSEPPLQGFASPHCALVRQNHDRRADSQAMTKMKTHLTIGKTAMTHSTAINSTITKETEATNVSPFEQSGSNKNECLKSENFPDFLSVFGKHDLILNSP